MASVLFPGRGRTLSNGDGDQAGRRGSGSSPATTVRDTLTAEQIDYQPLTAFPQIEPLAYEPAYIVELGELFEHHSAGGEGPLTESDDCCSCNRSTRPLVTHGTFYATRTVDGLIFDRRSGFGAGCS